MHSTILYEPVQAHQTLQSLWAWAKPRLMAGQRLTLSVKQEKRTVPQNSHIHPLVRAIAVEAGRPTDDESLRRLRYLLLEQWRSETHRAPLFERSLDGLRWVDVNKGTSDLDRPDCSEFIEWMEAWKATNAKP